MNVLSLFDGMSCGQIALERVGIKVDSYFASEIDKYAIQVTQYNYPKTIQLGDITKIKGSDLPKIDLIMGGSPCQGFSFAGKNLNFDDPRSKLFFEFVRLLKEIKPKYFLLENVRMKKESKDIITKCLGVDPIEINSALVSAQNRKRLYWTNISNIIKPKNKGLLLKDIIEDGFIDKNKSFCIDANYYREGNLKRYFIRHSRQLVFKDFLILQGIKKFVGERNNTIDVTNTEIKTLANKYRINHVKGLDDKARCLSTCCHSMTSTSGTGVYCNGIHRNLSVIECERLQTLSDDYTKYGILDIKPDNKKCAKQEVIAVIKNKGKLYIGTNTCETPQERCPRIGPQSGEGYEICKNTCHQKYHAEEAVCKKAGKNAYGGVLYLFGHTYCCEHCKEIINQYGIRKIIIGKLPKIKISNSQRYKMIGNGWTVDVVAHIFKGLK